MKDGKKLLIALAAVGGLFWILKGGVLGGISTKFKVGDLITPIPVDPSGAIMKVLAVEGSNYTIVQVASDMIEVGFPVIVPIVEVDAVYTYYTGGV